MYTINFDTGSPRLFYNETLQAERVAHVDVSYTEEGVRVVSITFQLPGTRVAMKATLVDETKAEAEVSVTFAKLPTPSWEQDYYELAGTRLYSRYSSISSIVEPYYVGTIVGSKRGGVYLLNLDNPTEGATPCWMQWDAQKCIARDQGLSLGYVAAPMEWWQS